MCSRARFADAGCELRDRIHVFRRQHRWRDGLARARSLRGFAFRRTGQIRFYDTRGKTQAGPTRYIGSTPDACVYVPKWDVFVMLASLEISVPRRCDAASLDPRIRRFRRRRRRAWSRLRPCRSSARRGEIRAPASSSTGRSHRAAARSPRCSPRLTDENGNATVNYIAPIGLTGSVCYDRREIIELLSAAMLQQTFVTQPFPVPIAGGHSRSRRSRPLSIIPSSRRRHASTARRMGRQHDGDIPQSRGPGRRLLKLSGSASRKIRVPWPGYNFTWYRFPTPRRARVARPRRLAAE